MATAPANTPKHTYAVIIGEEIEWCENQKDAEDFATEQARRTTEPVIVLEVIGVMRSETIVKKVWGRRG